MVKRRFSYLLRAALAVFVLALLVVPAVPANASPYEVVASGLNNPRGLAFGPEGALYIAEAGTGGSDSCVEFEEFGEVCIGLSSSITRVWKGEQERILTGLPSIAGEDGSFAIGLNDVSLHGRGNLVGVIGLGNNPELRSLFGEAGTLLGHLVRMTPGEKLSVLADVSAHELANNPDGVEPPDSNPYAVLAVPGGFVVADAGANALVMVHANGKTSTLAVFPEQMGMFPDGSMGLTQAVPTSVVQGPDGAYYVGLLHPIFNAVIYRVVPGEEPTIYFQGLPTVIDVAIDSAGNLYALDIFLGLLVKIAPDGTQTTIVEAGVLTFPGGLAIGPDGDLYVSNMSVFPGAGEVVRIDL